MKPTRNYSWNAAAICRARTQRRVVVVIAIYAAVSGRSIYYRRIHAIRCERRSMCCREIREIIVKNTPACPLCRRGRLPFSSCIERATTLRKRLHLGFCLMNGRTADESPVEIEKIPWTTLGVTRVGRDPLSRAGALLSLL